MDSRPVKKTRREEEESINVCYTKLHLFNKTLSSIQDIQGEGYSLYSIDYTKSILNLD